MNTAHKIRTVRTALDMRKVYHATRRNFPRLSARYALRFAKLAAKLSRSGLLHYGDSVKIITRPSCQFEIVPSEYTESGAYNPRISETVGYSQREVLTAKRWIESTDRAGLRFVGHADELCSGLGHTGWHTDPHGDGETLRGAVWQLPARSGRSQYVAGYVDPNNDGAALIDFDIIEGDRHAGGYWDRDEDTKREAARSADSIAERDAEREREYQYQWQAAQRVADELDTLSDSLSDIDTEGLDRERETALDTLKTAIETARSAMEY